MKYLAWFLCAFGAIAISSIPFITGGDIATSLGLLGFFALLGAISASLHDLE